MIICAEHYGFDNKSIMTKVAIVTGSNKGIGLSTVRALCKEFDGDVFLTSRNTDRGHAAVKLLEDEGLQVKYHQLDIEDKESIQQLHDFIMAQYGGIDVLVNNAGMAFKIFDSTPLGEQAEVTMNVNYFGTLNVCNILMPIIRAGGRVVNLSSKLALMNLPKCSFEKQTFFCSDTVEIDDLSKLMVKYIEHAKKGDHLQEGFSNSAYGMSKIAVVVLSRIYARKLKEEGKHDILVNACSPGLVRTDMTAPNFMGKMLMWLIGSKTPDKGAETPVYLATLPPGTTEPSGEFVRDKSVCKWCTTPTETSL